MKYVDTRPPKICHARPGDVVRLGDTSPSGFAQTPVPNGEGEPQLYMVCRFDIGKAKLRDCSSGLYTEENPLFLVSLTTGEARPMPHLSSRVEIVRDVQVVEGPVDVNMAKVCAEMSRDAQLGVALSQALKLGSPENCIDELQKIAQYSLRGSVEGRTIKSLVVRLIRAVGPQNN
jgi:hypothetical protein